MSSGCVLSLSDANPLFLNGILDLRPFFQERNWGTNQGLGVYEIYTLTPSAAFRWLY